MRFIGVYDYTVILTYLSLCSAVFGMSRALQGEFGLAIICLAVSGICDAFDGMVARTKKDRTEDEKAFGIQLDSLCDVVCFGFFPAFLCYRMGADSPIGMAVVMIYCLCAVIRLAYFNVLEAKRQQSENGCGKFFRGLPVTSAAIVFPIVYLFRFLVSEIIFKVLMQVVLFVMAFLFILDFKVPKIDWGKVIFRKA